MNSKGISEPLLPHRKPPPQQPSGGGGVTPGAVSNWAEGEASKAASRASWDGSPVPSSETLGLGRALHVQLPGETGGDSQKSEVPLSHLLLRGLDDQVDGEPILDPVLVQGVPVLENLACEDQDQLILLSLKPPGDLLFELWSRGKGHCRPSLGSTHQGPCL